MDARPKWHKSSALEEVEGVWLGAAVTPFPVPMTVFDFPSELLKEGVG